MNQYGNLSRLRYFRAVCENQTITKAAEVVSISQPSLTTAMKELEKELGIRLFHRDRNRISLTEQGEYVYDMTCKMLDMFDGYYKKIIAYGQLEEKTVSIGVPPALGAMIIPTIISDVQNECRDVKIKIYECVAQEAMKMLDQNAIELAFFMHDKVPSTYNYQVVNNTEISYWVHSRHPLAGRAFITEEEVCRYPLILLPEDSYHYKAAMDRFREAGVEPDVKLCTKQLYTIFRGIEETDGGTMLMKDVRPPNDHFVSIPFKTPLKAQYVLAWKKNGDQRSLRKKVLKSLAKSMGLSGLRDGDPV